MCAFGVSRLGIGLAVRGLRWFLGAGGRPFVSMDSTNSKPDVPEPRRRQRSLDEQVRVLGTPPVGSGEFYARDGIFGSAEEVDEFLDFLYESRRSDLA